MSLVTDLRILLDEQGGGVFWTDSQVYTALNRAQIDVWVASGWDTIKTTFTTNPASPSIAPDIFVFDASILIPQYFLRSNKRYFPTTMAKLEQYSRDWRSATATAPRWFARWDATRFRAFPKPDITYNFDLWGIRYPPTEITALATDITAPELLKRAVIYRAGTYLFIATRPDVAISMTHQADEYINRWNIQLRNRIGHRIYRLKPLVDVKRDQFPIAGKGVIKLARGFS